jgi:hypothetical protein
MKKLSLKTWISKLKLVLVRFPFTLIFIIGLSVLFFLSIQKVNLVIRDGLWAFFILGTLLNIAVTLYLEEFKKQSYRILFNILASVLLAVYCFTLPEKLFEYQSYQMGALGIVFVLSAFFVSFLKKNNEIPFWNFCRNNLIELVVTSVFSLVLFGGISLAILSLDKLFNIHIDYKVYTNLSVVCFVIFAPVYFLSNVPDEIEKRKQDFTFQKVIKIFGLYILLPILAAYTLILYVYLFRIIFKWELPDGWVSTLVSVLGMVGFLCMMILYPLRLMKGSKLVDMLSRYFPVVLFPLLVLMSVGIFRRLGDYGLTINRCYVLILNVWLFGISFYLFFTQSKHVKWIVISFTIIAFLSSVGPWSVYHITRHSIISHLDKQLGNPHMFKNGKLILTANKTTKTDSINQMNVVEDIRYLVRTYGNDAIQKYFSFSLKGKSEYEILSLLKMDKVPNTLEYFWMNLQEKSCMMDTHSYKSFMILKMNSYDKTVYNDEKVSVEFSNNCFLVRNKTGKSLTYMIPLNEKIKSLMHEKWISKINIFPIEDMTLKGSNYVLVLKKVNGNYDFLQNTLHVTELEAYLFN